MSWDVPHPPPQEQQQLWQQQPAWQPPPPQPGAEWQQQPWQPQPAGPQPMCQMTRPELQSLLERSGFGQDAAVFNMYFRPSLYPGGPPVCNNCNRPIAEHPAGAAAPGYVQPTFATRIDPNALPVGMVRDGSIDKYENTANQAVGIVGLVLFVVVVILFIVMMSTISVFAVIFPAPFALLLTFAPVRNNISFDRSRREWHHERIRIIWRCCSDSKNGNFTDFESVIQEETSRSKHGVKMRVGLKLQGSGEVVPLQEDLSSSEVLQAFEAWTVYFESNIRRAH